ncbi:MAG TPA: hypothetical protein VMZ31_18440 [Phycisphaerae bacterium]|nr:hypothetical protein [Phycisphaerae bacterium]
MMPSNALNPGMMMRATRRLGRGAPISPVAWAAAAALLCVTVPGAAADVWNVSTFGELRTAAFSAVPGDEIVIAAGSYHVTNSLYITTPDLTFRGATGDRDDVVLYGNGMNVESGVLEGFWAAANGIRLENLTIRDFWHHGIHICGTPYADNVVVSNVKTVNCGERHVKGSSGSGVSDNVLIEDLWMEQTEAYLPRPGHSVDEYNYIGGIDAMHLNGWTIRRCTAANIMGAAASSRAGFFLWNGVSDLVLEQSTVIRCGHAISIGNPSGPSGSHVDPWHAVGGMIRNNFILRANLSIDNWALELDNTKDFKVYNNTIYSDDATYFRTVQIYDEASEGLTTNLDIQQNILRGRILDLTVNGGWTIEAVRAMGNIVDGDGSQVVPAWFVDAANADLHLTDLATDAIEQADTLADVTEDIDGDARPVGLGPDFGADEYIPELFSSEPPADGTLPKTQNNVILLTFSAAITLPGGPALSIVPLGGGADQGGAFGYAIEPDGVTLKALEQGTVLTDQTWYQVTPVAGLAVQPFALDVCTLIGDCNDNGRVTTADYTCVKGSIGVYTEDRRDLDGSGRVTTSDYIVVKEHLGRRVPPKP